MTLFTQSMNELEYYAELILDSIPRSKRREVDVLKTMNPMTLAYKAAIELNSSVDTFKSLTTVCCSLGSTVLVGMEDMSDSEEKINIRRFGVGYELISPLLENRKIKLEKGMHIRDPYYMKSEDEEFLNNLFHIVNTHPLEIPIHSRPTYEEPKPFTSFTHPVAGDLVRKANHEVVSYFKEENCPDVFEAINKHMTTPYIVNQDVLDVYKELRNDEPLLTLVGTNYTDEQKSGMLREINGTLDIAIGVGKRTFWEYMFYDTRGRLYSSAVYFTHQGSKLSKSLFYFKDTKKIGREGWFWMLVHAANLAGKDKLPVDDRFVYAQDMLDEWMVWAEDPINERGWTESDDPFCFLAVIMEIHKALKLENKFNYRSGLPIAWDATCSGLQILATISRDEKSGKLCNLIDQEEVSDYYASIASHVWGDINVSSDDKWKATRILEEIDQMSAELEEMKKDENLVAINKQANTLRKKLKPLKKKVDKLGDECPQEIVDAQWDVQNQLDELGEDKINNMFQAIGDMWFGEDKNVELISKVFFNDEEVRAMSRKICKRPCMTYFYSCQARTMAKQLLRDHKAKLPDLRKQFCMWIAIKIFNACQTVMPGPTAVMNSFINLGIKAYGRGEDFALIAPRTLFKMMHKYRACVYKNMKINYRGKRIRLKLMVSRSEKLDYQKIISAVSPNVVHMLDGQLVASILLDTKYNVLCIHDSFSACPADAGKLYEDTRASFVELFREDVLQDIFDQHNEENPIEYGELDLDGIANNQYCFS